MNITVTVIDNPPKPDKKRQVLNGQTRQFVILLRDYFKREHENGGTLLPVSQVVERVADAFNISRRTVSRICKEQYEPKLSPKKRNRKKPVTDLDDAEKDAIRRHVNEYYTRKEQPSFEKILLSLKTAGLFNGEKTSLRKILKKIGFHFKTRERKKGPVEKKVPRLTKEQREQKERELEIKKRQKAMASSIDYFSLYRTQ